MFQVFQRILKIKFRKGSDVSCTQVGWGAKCPPDPLGSGEGVSSSSLATLLRVVDRGWPVYPCWRLKVRYEDSLILSEPFAGQRAPGAALNSRPELQSPTSTSFLTLTQLHSSSRSEGRPVSWVQSWGVWCPQNLSWIWMTSPEPQFMVALRPLQARLWPTTVQR